MPRKTKPPAKAVTTPELNVPQELLDQLVKGPMTQADLESMFRSLKKAVIERAMGAEMSDHLGYRQRESKPEGQFNQRNGTTGKTVITDDGPVRIEVPRDQDGSFEPQIIGKHERRFTGFDQKIIAMYARGMTIREIQGYLAEMYGTEVSPEFISKVTDEVTAEITAWQSRPLEPMYPVVFFDALRVKIRDDATRPSTSPWVSCPTVRETCWGPGSSRPKEPNSGSRCSTSFAAAVSGTSSLQWSMASKACLMRLKRRFPAPRSRPASSI